MFIVIRPAGECTKKAPARKASELSIHYAFSGSFFCFAGWSPAFLALFPRSCHFTQIDVATQMEEYAPLMKPIIMTSAKFFVVSPPKKYSDATANMVVVRV